VQGLASVKLALAVACRSEYRHQTWFLSRSRPLATAGSVLLQLPGTEFIRYSILPLGIFSLRSRSPSVRRTEPRQLHSSSSFFSVSVFVFLVWFSFPVQVGRPRRNWHVLVCVMTSTHNDQTTSLIHCTDKCL
jgi:hypothetical protein